jgi:hypothetical protein
MARIRLVVDRFTDPSCDTMAFRPRMRMTKAYNVLHTVLTRLNVTSGEEVSANRSRVFATLFVQGVFALPPMLERV